MGHRALVCYQRERDRWDCYYSHWGAVRLALEEPLTDGLQPGETAGRLQDVPVAHNQLGVDDEPEGEVANPQEIVDLVLDWGRHEALYLVPGVGEIQAFLALEIGEIYGALDSPLGNGVLIRPRQVDGRRLTTAVTSRWRGWKEGFAVCLRRELVDADEIEEDLNGLAYRAWGKPARPEFIPGYSPLGYDAVAGATNISRLMASCEQSLTDPDR